MKRILLITNLFLFVSSVVLAQTKSYVSRQKAWEIVRENVLKNNTDSIFVYAAKEVKASSSPIKTIFGSETTPAFESWFFFIDDMPLANWEHPCRYAYVNTQTGEYELPVLADMTSASI